MIKGMDVSELQKDLGTDISDLSDFFNFVMETMPYDTDNEKLKAHKYLQMIVLLACQVFDANDVWDQFDFNRTIN